MQIFSKICVRLLSIQYSIKTDHIIQGGALIVYIFSVYKLVLFISARATSEKNTGDDWGQIMDICDKVKESNTGSKDCLKSIVKRLNSENPRIVLQAVTVSCVPKLYIVITVISTVTPVHLAENLFYICK